GDDRNNRNFQSRHFAEIARNCFGLAALFGPQSWICAWRIYKRHDRTAKFLSDFHRPKGFAITFWIRHAKIAVNLLLGVAGLLMAHDHLFVAVEARYYAEYFGVICVAVISVTYASIGINAQYVV